MKLRFLPVIALATSAASAQSTDSIAAARGRAQIARAYTVLGGDSVARRIVTIDVRGSGTEWRSAEVQGPSPGRETPTPHEEWIVADLREDRVSHEYRTQRHDGSLRWRRFMYDGEERVFGDFVGRSAGRGHAPASAETRRELTRRFPHLLLAEVAANGASVRALGDSVLDGAVHHVVSYTPTGRQTPLRLFIDRRTGHLRKVSHAIDFPGLGPVDVAFELMPYTPHPELRFVPAGHSIRLAKARFQEVRYAHVRLNDARSDSAFLLPEDLRPFVSDPGAVRRVAPGVFVVEGLGGFNTMFVEFREFVMAIEAPATHPALAGLPTENSRGSLAVSQAFVERIEQTIAGKPIRYVAITHFHSDHAGGVRAFLDRGATILTTPTNRVFFERLGAPVASIETIAGKRVVTDGVQTVELIDVGRNPHTDEMLVAYLPASGILFQGDLFYFYGENMLPEQGRIGIMRHFGEWLRKNDIEPTRIYGVHGTGYATMEHVRRILMQNAR